MTRAEFINNHRLYEKALLNFANKLTRDPNEAEDLVQETFIKAFRSKDSFMEGSSFKSWSFTILKNCFITRYRKTKRRGLIGADISAYNFCLQGSAATRNEGVSKLYVEEINDCMNVLSYKMKVPFKLFLEGYKYNEISDMLNIPIGTVKSRINFTRKKLQETLLKKGIAA